MFRLSVPPLLPVLPSGQYVAKVRYVCTCDPSSRGIFRPAERHIDKNKPDVMFRRVFLVKSCQFLAACEHATSLPYPSSCTGCFPFIKTRGSERMPL
jgi:hypothetical protein